MSMQWDVIQCRYYYGKYTNTDMELEIIIFATFFSICPCWGFCEKLNVLIVGAAVAWGWVPDDMDRCLNISLLTFLSYQLHTSSADWDSSLSLGEDCWTAENDDDGLLIRLSEPCHWHRMTCPPKICKFYNNFLKIRIIKLTIIVLGEELELVFDSALSLLICGEFSNANASNRAFSSLNLAMISWNYVIFWSRPLLISA